MKNVGELKNCYGCGVCALACPKKILDLQLNLEGFYEPFLIDSKKCVNCGLCLEVCSFMNPKISLEREETTSYAGYSKDLKIRRKCSSGGVAYEISRYLLEHDYEVCGVRYNVGKDRVEHFIAKDSKELEQTIGSKYLQSYTVDALKQIDKNKKNLIIGSPCQIDSLRRYIRKFKCEDNFVLIDFFCHGVPTALLWNKYKKWAEGKVGNLTFVSWRNKWNGWHDSWAMGISGSQYDWHDSYNMLIGGEKNKLESRWSNGDMFFNLFLGDCCLGKQCYDSCKFKQTYSSADIRIGDLWGKTFQHDNDGVNGIITLTYRGRDILQHSNCVLQEVALSTIMEGQMKKNAIKTYAYKVVMNALRTDKTAIEECNNRFIRISWILRNVNRIKHPMALVKFIYLKFKNGCKNNNLS